MLEDEISLPECFIFIILQNKHILFQLPEMILQFQPDSIGLSCKLIFCFITLKNCGHKPWIEREAKQRFYEILEEELE